MNCGMIFETRFSIKPTIIYQKSIKWYVPAQGKSISHILSHDNERSHDYGAESGKWAESRRCGRSEFRRYLETVKRNGTRRLDKTTWDAEISFRQDSGQVENIQQEIEPDCELTYKSLQDIS